MKEFKAEHTQLMYLLLGEEYIAQQQNDDAEKAAHFEEWFKQEVLGHRSSYRSE